MEKKQRRKHHHHPNTVALMDVQKGQGDMKFVKNMKELRENFVILMNVVTKVYEEEEEECVQGRERSEQ